MKNKIVKILTLFISLTFITAAFSSCGKSHVTDGAKSTEEELRAVGTVGGYEVLYDEYRYVALSCREMLETKYGDGIFDDAESAAKYEQELYDMVMARITANYAVLTLCDEHGYKNALSDKDTIKKVDQTIDALLYETAILNEISVSVSTGIGGNLKYKYEKGGLDKAYGLLHKEMAYYYTTERVMRITLGVEYAFEVLINVLTAKENKVIYLDEDIEDFMFSDEFICTRHIFIENEKGDDIEANRAKAEEALAKYRSGEMTMEKLIGSIYNEDISMGYEGNYFTRGEMDVAYEDAAFALEVGQVSDVIEGENGFYIIERREKSNTFMLSNLEKFGTQITYAIINRMVRERQAELSITLNDFGKSIVLSEIPTTRGEENE